MWHIILKKIKCHLLFWKKNYENLRPLTNADDLKKRIFLEKMYKKTKGLKAVPFASQVD
jgi:hypothetical protein